MGYERDNQRDYYNRSQRQDYGRDYGSGRDYSSTSARSYEAMGMMGDRDDRGWNDEGGRGYGRGNYGNDMNRGSYGSNRDRDDDNGRYGARDYGYSGYDQSNRMPRGGGRNFGSYDQGRSNYGSNNEYRGSYAADGRRFGNYDRDDNRSGDRNRNRDYGRQPQGYDYDDRGFMARAGDEVRSWFGDEEAERRREADMRYDERYYNDRDADYGNWRRNQIDALDRDYNEYRQENRSKFENEFSSWRSERQTQRNSLNDVKEHMDVQGSDGEHVGTVDKVRGDRILLTKNDSSDGHHHSIPSRWIDKVDDKVTIRKTAEEAKKHWRDEEGNQAMFGDKTKGSTNDMSGDRNLNRSFSGTY